MAADVPAPRLKRSLSLPLITLYGLGTTIGAGIYVLVGKVAGHAGLYAPLSFLIAALLAGLTALAFAELCARYPKSAGEALYVREGLGSNKLALVVGLMVALAGLVSAAAITLGAAGYAASVVALPKVVVVISIALAIGVLAAVGILESVTAASVFTLLEIGGLVLVVWAGAGTVPDVSAQLPALLPSLDGAVWAGIFAGALLAFYAFIGFEDMVNVAEEVKDVTRLLPLAIVLTLVITTVIYVAVAIVAVLAVPPAELAASEAPLVLIYETGGGGLPQLVTGIAIFATLNGALIQIIMASRILYGLAHQGALPAILGRVNPLTHTPLLSTAIVTAAVLVLAIGFRIEILAEATSIVALAIFTLVNLSLMRIKARHPRPAGIAVLPAFVPLLGFLASGLFLLLEALRRGGVF